MNNKLNSSRQIILICVVIVVAFAASAIMFTVSGFKNTRAFVEQITDMSAMNLISNIDESMMSSVSAAKIMAGNSFVIDWAEKETNHANDSDYINKLYNYLKTYQEGNNYNFLFYASKNTEKIYYQDSVNPKMSSQNAEDRWIFDFLDSNLQYKFSLNPFKPSADSDNVSLLIMYKLIGENGKTLGAIGMNINLGVVERSIVEIGNEYNVGVAFSDLEGNIMISKDSALPKGTNIFNEGGIIQNIEPKPLPLEGAVTRKWISDGGLITSKHFCEIRYLGAFNWYLIIYGSGDSIIRATITQLALQLAMLAVLLLLMIAVIINTISQYRNQIISLATLDELTKIMNRKSFMARFEYFSKQSLLEGGHLFLIDIDFFKTINDTLGHAAGDEALSFLSDKLGDCVDHEGFIGRWGGDEFIGVFFSTVADPLEKIKALSLELAETETGKRMHITLSAGIAAIEAGLPLNKVVEKADIALYTSKKKGRNQATLYHESQTGAEPEYSKELIENSKKSV